MHAQQVILQADSEQMEHQQRVLQRTSHYTVQVCVCVCVCVFQYNRVMCVFIRGRGMRSSNASFVGKGAAEDLTTRCTAE